MSTPVQTASLATPSIGKALLGDAFDMLQLLQKIAQGMATAKAALDDAKRKIVEYDKQHNISAKAEQVLSTSVEKVNQAFATLVSVTQTIKEEIPVDKISRALTQVNDALTQLVEQIHQYDEQYKLSTSLTNCVATHKDQFAGAIALVAGYSAEAAAAANAQLQGVSDGLRARLATVAKAGLVAANKGLDVTLPVAAKVDSQYHVSDIAAQSGSVIVSQLKELNEKFGLLGYVGVATGKALEMDQQVTGGKISPKILAAYNMGLAAVYRVQEKYSEAKQQLTDAHMDQPSKA
jgi:ABC-type transporter Mla subunit MlaD